MINVSTKLFTVVLLTWNLVGCQQEPEIVLSPADRLRAAITSADDSIAVGGITLRGDTSTDVQKINCRIVVLMSPDSGLLMQPVFAESLIDTVTAAVSSIYPAAVHLNLFISTRPDTDKFQSADTLELDGLILKLGMNRAEIGALLDGSEWRISSEMSDYWGLTAGWPKVAEVYFESKEDDAKTVFFLPKFNGSGGGMSVISVKVPLQPMTELNTEAS